MILKNPRESQELANCLPLPLRRLPYLQCIVGVVVVRHKETGHDANMVERQETNRNVLWTNCGAQAPS